MNTARPDLIIGNTLCANNSSDYVFEATGGPGFGSIPPSELDGKLLEVYVRYPDNVTAGYEQCWGIYTHSTRTVARTVIGRSSAGEGVKVNWGSSAPKYILATIAGSALSNMASICIGLPPWVEPRVGGTGQSNNAHAGVYLDQGSAPSAVDDRVWHYATSGANTNTSGSRSWMALNPSTQVNTLEITGTGPFTGAGRSIYDTPNSVWVKTTNPTYSFARLLSIVSGRRVRVVNSYSIGVTIDNATNGWQYDPSISTLTSTRFAADVTAAIAALDASQLIGGSKLHFLVYMQGESDMTQPKTSGLFAHKLSQFVGDCYSPTKHNICDSNTITLILGPSTDVQRGNPKFNGFALAKDIIGEKAIYIPAPTGVDTYDNLHIFGESCDLYADAMIRAVASPAGKPNQTQPAWRVQRNDLEYSVNDNFVLQTTGTGAVASADQMRFTTGFDFVRISKLAGFFSLGGNAWNRGMKNLRAGDTFQISTTDALNAANRRNVTITGPVTEYTDYGLWPCSTTTNGTAPVATDRVYLNSSQTIFDGEDFSASTELHTDFGKLVHGQESSDYAPPNQSLVQTLSHEYKQLYLDANGRLYRHNALPEIHWVYKSTDATASTTGLFLFSGIQGQLWNAEHVSLQLLIKRNSDNVISRGTVDFLAVNAAWGGTATISQSLIDKSTAPNFDNLTLPSDWVAVSSYSYFGVGVWEIRLKGVAATALSWTISGRVRPALTQA